VYASAFVSTCRFCAWCALATAHHRLTTPSTHLLPSTLVRSDGPHPVPLVHSDGVLADRVRRGNAGHPDTHLSSSLPSASSTPGRQRFGPTAVTSGGGSGGGGAVLSLAELELNHWASAVETTNRKPPIHAKPNTTASAADGGKTSNVTAAALSTTGAALSTTGATAGAALLQDSFSSSSSTDGHNAVTSQDPYSGEVQLIRRPTARPLARRSAREQQQSAHLGTSFRPLE
jgi:hypothetical protein